MSVLKKLRKQMTVISNHRYRESCGGYSIYFVGMGDRRIDFQGWWKTDLDFYSIDAVGFSQRVRVNGREELVRDENAVSLFSNDVFYEEYYESAGKYEDAWIVFRPTDHRSEHPLKKIVGRKGFCLFKDNQRIVRQRIAEIAHIASADPGLRLVAQAAFLQTLAHLAQAYSGAPSETRLIGPLVTEAGAQDSFRTKILAILKSDFRDDISVEELARRLSISRSTLSHRFSSEMGETMVQMKNRLRIRRAQELMADSSKQLKEVAFEVGLDDPAYFTRLFKKVAGISPSDYRRLALRGNH